MIKHQQVRAEKRSFMFVLENKINKQHVYRWSQEKNGSSLWLLGGENERDFVFLEICLILCFNIIINCEMGFGAPAGLISSDERSSKVNTFV